MFHKLNFKSKLAFLIIILIGFQQFPVFRVGGSFKVYELLAIILLITDIATLKTSKIYGPISIIAFVFFVISPIISFFFSNIFLGYPEGFFLKYEEANSLKFNYFVFPLLQLIYMLFNFSVFNCISGSYQIATNLNKVLKISVIIGTCISFYSIISIFTVDVVQYLPSIIQFKSHYNFRSSGLSQEPSFYVLYQSWICLIAWFTKHLFYKRYWYIIITTNIFSLIFTFSSSLIGLVIIIFLSIFIFKTKFKVKAYSLATIALIVIIGYFIVETYNLNGIFNYFFVSKTSNFLTTQEYTTDSGSFRNYTTRIGFQIFKDYWLTGVGVGNSIYYMYLYEFKMGISVFGETLSPGSFPQNMISMVFAEQGIIGGLSLFALLLYISIKLWINRNKGRYHKMFFIGFLFNVVAMLSIAPTYSLFLWVFIALAINYNRYYSYNNLEEKISVSRS